ncbi:hypothetical protein [Leucobacter chinensis]|uniref:hypothetical protein n=1 Tax=Leucobacter chinensis TaxID=2851010 RepID=UPI001C234589|nr:hypothetical protein [Leucobacter chinensis]
METRSRMPHLVRGSFAAVIATFGALFAHVLGGGHVPGPLGLCAPLILSLAVCVLLAGRTLSLTRLSISVLLSQTLFHTLFVLGTPVARLASGGPMPSGAHHHGHGAAELAAASGQVMTHVHGDATMWFSHLIGAAITVAFLHRGERTLMHLWELAQRFVTRLRVWVALLPAPVAPRETARQAAQHTVTWSVLTRLSKATLIRRGPPAVLLPTAKA